MSAALLLDRLQRVKRTAPGRWLARCPAHEDRSPSLSVRELDDGRLLVHDFGGCAVGDVLGAIGLALSDLFPGPLCGHSHPTAHSRIPARDLLEVVSEETTIVAMMAADILAKKTISDTDWARLAKAADRIGRCRDHAYGR
jgi:hypothetical protein